VISRSGSADLLEHAQELAQTMPALEGVGLVVETEARSPDAVASLICEAAQYGWRGRRDPL
jgi:hypothetical protein